MQAYINLANSNNKSELNAFLELDTHRFRVKNELGSQLKNSKKNMKRYQELAGIDKSLQGGN